MFDPISKQTTGNLRQYGIISTFFTKMLVLFPNLVLRVLLPEDKEKQWDSKKTLVMVLVQIEFKKENQCSAESVVFVVCFASFCFMIMYRA